MQILTGTYTTDEILDLGGAICKGTLGSTTILLRDYRGTRYSYHLADDGKWLQYDKQVLISNYL